MVKGDRVNRRGLGSELRVLSPWLSSNSCLDVTGHSCSLGLLSLKGNVRDMHP